MSAIKWERGDIIRIEDNYYLITIIPTDTTRYNLVSLTKNPGNRWGVLGTEEEIQRKITQQTPAIYICSQREIREHIKTLLDSIYTEEFLRTTKRLG
jgi:hypothetical protein